MFESSGIKSPGFRFNATVFGHPDLAACSPSPGHLRKTRNFPTIFTGNEDFTMGIVLDFQKERGQSRDMGE